MDYVFIVHLAATSIGIALQSKDLDLGKVKAKAKVRGTHQELPPRVEGGHQALARVGLHQEAPQDPQAPHPQARVLVVPNRDHRGTTSTTLQVLTLREIALEEGDLLPKDPQEEVHPGVDHLVGQEKLL